MQGGFVNLRIHLSFFPVAYADNFLENDLLVQSYSLQDTSILDVKEGEYTGLYDYYTCDSCGRSYQSTI